MSCTSSSRRFDETMAGVRDGRTFDARIPMVRPNLLSSNIFLYIPSDEIFASSNLCVHPIIKSYRNTLMDCLPTHRLRARRQVNR